jgi:hypothetical protein
LGDTHCPEGVGWVGRGSDDVAFRLQLSPPFRVGEVFFYRGDPHLENVFCNGDGHTVYFYRRWARPGAGTVSIEARTLPEFRLAWAGDIPLAEVEPETQPRDIKIQTLEQSDGDLTIHFVNEQSGRWVVAKLSSSGSSVQTQHH